jgi:MarR family transcriptional regulator, organic hydroperoxide resistance regulator
MIAIAMSNQGRMRARRRGGDGRASVGGGGRREERRLGKVLEFMRLIWAVTHELQATSKRMNAVYNVTGSQRLVVRVLGCYPHISAGEVSSILHVHPSTLTGVFRRLQERGVIERLPDPNDGRRACFRLTARGTRIDALSVGTVESAVSRVLGAMPDHRVRSAEEFLTALAAALAAQRPTIRRQPRRS